MSQPSNHKLSDDTPLIPNPVNLDRPIQELQIELGTKLSWLERSFGRSWMAYKNSTSQSNKVIYYPEVYQGPDKDLLNVGPGNDNLSSYSFIRVHEPGQVIEYAPNQYNNLEYTISIIFWMDLKRVNPIKAYDFTEELKAEIQRVITNFGFSTQSELQILRVWETAARVFEGYTIDMVDKQQLVYPRRGLRYECRLQHLEDCI